MRQREKERDRQTDREAGAQHYQCCPGGRIVRKESIETFSVENAWHIIGLLERQEHYGRIILRFILGKLITGAKNG
jgi:hypothetical protein